MVHFTIHPVNPQRHLLARTVEILRQHDGICVYPTDTVYGIGSTVSNAKALDKIGRLLERDKTRTFSFICSDFSQMSTYARISNTAYRIMRHHLPGPFTFILPATNFVPKKVCPKRRTVGVRMPACAACTALVEALGEPLANTSIRLPGEPGELRADPDAILPALLHEIDVLLDVGTLDDPRSSTIVDLTTDTPAVLRDGKGVFNG